METKMNHTTYDEPRKDTLNTKNRSGFVLLLSLLAIVLGMMIYGFVLHRSDLKVRHQQEQSPGDYPWTEESLIVDKDSGKQVQEPYPEQAQFTKAVELFVRVNQDDQRRGKMSLLVRPDGMVFGSWNAKYKNKVENISHEVMLGDFEGNIVPSIVYTDQNDEEDQSKLFFITKGNFVMIEELHNNNNRVRRVQGNIYVTGWIEPDLSATGKLHLTSDKVNQIIYQWRALAGKPVENPF